LVWLLCALALVTCTKQEAVQPNSQQAFETLAKRCKMEFQIPSGFTYANGQSAEGLDYEAVLLANGGGLEVRLALRALQDAEVDYQDPHSSKPAPEHIYPLLYTAIVQEIATDPYSASGGFGENALSEFHADWGQMSVLTPKESFAGGYASMMFLAIHRRAAADAYMVFLFNDYETVKAQIQTAMTSLRFLDLDTVPATLPGAGAANNGKKPVH
jgi:hypothetical protein